MIKIITTPLEFICSIIYCTIPWIIISIIITLLVGSLFNSWGVYENIKEPCTKLDLPKINTKLPVYFKIEFDDNGVPIRGY